MEEEAPVAAAAAVAVAAAAVPPVASSGEYAVLLASSDNRWDGGAQHVQDARDVQHAQAQLTRNEGPSAHGHADDARGATKLHCAQNPCEQNAAVWG
jgi:hypothetical protein